MTHSMMPAAFPSLAWLLVVVPSAPSPDGGLTANQQARSWLDRGQPQKALQALLPLGTDATSVLKQGVGEGVGLLGLAAAGSGNTSVAEQAFDVLRHGAELPPLARFAAEIRFLEVCARPCRPLKPAPVGVMDASVRLATRYLLAVTPVDAELAVGAAREVVKASVWRDKSVPPVERAELLAATHAALLAGGDGDGATALRGVAWETLPAEPALKPLLATTSDPVMLEQRGLPSALSHLEALELANDNAAVILFGNLLCKGTVATCPALAPAQRCQVALAVGKAQRQSRKYAQAEATLAVVADACPAEAPRALFHAARAMIAQKGGSKRAVAALDQLVKTRPDSNLADDALVLAGETSKRNGNPRAAQQYWTTVLEKYPDADMADEALWWLAWSADAAGEGAAAVQRLEQLLTVTAGRNIPLWRRAAYWSGRLHPDAKAGQAHLLDLVTSQPLSFEASLARGWLKRQGVAFPDLPDAAVARAAVPNLAAPAEMDGPAVAGLALTQLGLHEDAAQMFLASRLLKPPQKAEGSAGPDVWIAERLLAVGEAAIASRWVRRHHAQALQGVPNKETVRLWRLAYPAAFAAALEGAAKEMKLPGALMFALAREESAFDPAVTSWAGAVGLTQLMPTTALHEAAALKVDAPDPAALRDPVLNARLGAAHLSRHMRRFHGNPVLALAAYNAGPGTVSRWVQRAPDAELDRFVEGIPITETRGYVKRVVESYVIYRWLHGRGGGLCLPQRATEAVEGL